MVFISENEWENGFLGQTPTFDFLANIVAVRFYAAAGR